MNLHEQFYKLREACWVALDEMVRAGSANIGEFPVEEKGASPLIIYGIVANPDYNVHPEKQSDEDIVVEANKIEVIIDSNSKKTIFVTPDLLDLQELCTYLSGGFQAYN